MVNINKLKGRIIEKGTTITELSKVIGIDRSTLYRKLKNDGVEITIKEASLIIDFLKLSSDDINSIFFN